LRALTVNPLSRSSLTLWAPSRTLNTSMPFYRRCGLRVNSWKAIHDGWRHEFEYQSIPWLMSDESRDNVVDFVPNPTHYLNHEPQQAMNHNQYHTTTTTLLIPFYYCRFHNAVQEENFRVFTLLQWRIDLLCTDTQVCYHGCNVAMLPISSTPPYHPLLWTVVVLPTSAPRTTLGRTMELDDGASIILPTVAPVHSQPDNNRR